MELPADLYRLYEGLPRQGPGSDDLTREALRRLGPLPASPRVLDLGCGSGKQTLVLARSEARHEIDLSRRFGDTYGYVLCRAE